MAAEDEVDAGHAARHLDIHVHAVVREQDDRVRFLVGANLIDNSACGSSSRIPKVQLGMKRFGLAIGV
jgi:hypothetical protein